MFKFKGCQIFVETLLVTFGIIQLNRLANQKYKDTNPEDWANTAFLVNEFRNLVWEKSGISQGTLFNFSRFLEPLYTYSYICARFRLSANSEKIFIMQNV